MTVNRSCLDCPAVGPWERGRCPTHHCANERRRDRNPQRRAVKAARYNAAYRAARRVWEPAVESGGVNCARCALPIVGRFDLDHIDTGLHPAHPSCNRSARSNPSKEP